MQFIVCDSYDEMSRAGAEIIADLMKAKPACILGLATGSTPVGMYRELIRKNREGEIDFSAVETYNLDEYYPITPDNDQSYRYFMNKNLFDEVNIDKAKTHVPNGAAADADAACREYDTAYALTGGADIVTAATPLSYMHQGQLPEASVLDAFLGNVGGCIGETSALLLLIGFVYLLARRVLTVRIPLAYIGTVAVLAFLFPQGHGRMEWMAYQLFSGGLMLGAIFMATDYVTSPVTRLGQVVYGIGCGGLTVLFRYFGLYPEGVTYAILLMNALVWVIDYYTPSRRFGTRKGGADK